ncbi:MAG: F0F1-type ATP synthase subunit gamma [uncultured bacterium]|nr:MAG: F0F1-type ATP synthase subunit gamma [uncultured bacterium]
MAQIKEIKGRIKSVKYVQQITKAMKLVSAAKLRKSETRFHYFKEYLHKQDHIASFMQTKNLWNKTFLTKPKENVTKKGYVVFSGDKGFCGSFNSNVFKKAVKEIKNNNQNEVKIIGVGKNVNILFERNNYELLLDIRDVFGQVSFKHARNLSNEIFKFYEEDKFDELYLIYNRFKPKNEESIAVIPLIPMPINILKNITHESDYLYEPGIQSFMDNFITNYFILRLYYYLLESEAAEFLARMTSMDSATNNATELINTLTLDYNRARQAIITKEILDIVGGAEALK